MNSKRSWIDSCISSGGLVPGIVDIGVVSMGENWTVRNVCIVGDRDWVVG